ncbi:hypothetical protein KDA_28450 [Dictyobacter alpinus]|uniref:Glycosyltransferase RgtA/B/C/D-like domain-containing protein n=2 Tax=Dictyobacter alpinus TaxID=2014873 RepID=A0A402B7M4_9CHLR|nr:hypothetical protein KDA_28450 [Dictyobacter alpinus]
MSWQGAALGILVLVAIVIRAYLAYQSWPLPNSDESTMGVMSMHIQRGAHPVIYYGQYYMGVLQAYLGAFFFTFFGSSLFALRLGMILLYVGFLLSIYWLVAQLYTKRFAIFIVALFCFGSAAMLTRQLTAIGGYPETILFSTLSLAIGLRLALTAPTGELKNLFIRYGLFFFWGVSIGLGIWNDTLILPWVACSSLLLLFSWRELVFKGAILILLVGLFLGGLPLIIDNLLVPARNNTVAVLLGQVNPVPLTLHTLYQQAHNVFTVSLPTMIGSPTCYKSEFPFLQYWSFGTTWYSYCTVTNTIWSACFVLLSLIATGMVVYALAKKFLPLRRRTLSLEDRQFLVLQCARLVLLCGIAGTVLPYLRSGVAIDEAGVTARYLIGVWISFPALLWPLWVGGTRLQWSAEQQISLLEKIGKVGCLSLLALFLCILIYGTGTALAQVPAAQQAVKDEDQFIATLKSQGVTHLYADYWISYRLNFTTKEGIIGASIRYDSQRSSKISYVHNRYAPYFKEVVADPSAVYVLDKTDTRLRQAVEKKIKADHYSYKITDITNDYIMIRPIRS